MDLARDLLAGDVRALARAISPAEDRDPQARALVARLQGLLGPAHPVGLTGPPGRGKAPLGGAERTRRLVQDALALARKPGWQPPVILTSAAREDGLDRLWEAIRKHRDHLADSGELRSRRLRRVKQEIVALVAEHARKEAESVLEGDSAVARKLAGQNGPVNPYALAGEVLAQVARDGGAG